MVGLLWSHLPVLPFQVLPDYTSVLIDHLGSLHTHLSSSRVCSDPSVAPLFVLNGMMDHIATSELYAGLKSSEGVVEDMFEKAAQVVENAVQRSLEGLDSSDTLTFLRTGGVTPSSVVGTAFHQ